ncbi:ATP-dependent RNA helicase [Galdieria sulphuraria]|uniref:ATP-dependent RNA helicase n=1 Tax=Galdieria sulphuraria TaxID=130081 RepID=M2XT02_GALSU|nr:ATP-dependent RNA helicase [Galdieria sulphuraria]EME26559.1 ATP-dependent RNA helicase [Galdieria sulphuraria]|eukprot:XP_005703079.1 ATP-dependent RNA helicase [Galdieria sulphuraria]
MECHALEILWQDIKTSLVGTNSSSSIPCAWKFPTLVSQASTMASEVQATSSITTNSVRRQYSIECLLQLSGSQFLEHQFPLSLNVLKQTNKRKREKVETEEKKEEKVSESKLRSEDIIVKGKNSSLTFEDMFLSNGLIAGLKICGFEKPSPVQVASIPYARLGCDLIIQAKSGTGKTCVYAVAVLQSLLDSQKNTTLSSSVKSIQAMIIVPTRELAFQVAMVFEQLRRGIIECDKNGIQIVTCVGGISMKHDYHVLSKGFHVVIGTPGRIRNLIDSAILHLQHIQMLIIDEADKLLESCFWKDLFAIEQHLPDWKQVLAFSATYSSSVLSKLYRIMKEPRKITVLEQTLVEKLSLDRTPLCAETSLCGITHHKAEIQGSWKGEDLFHIQLETLISIFGEFSFHQCLVFCNDKSLLDRYSNSLRNAGFSADFTSGDLNQSIRNEIFQRFYTHKTQVLLTTDLLSRGIDFVDCNLVVNLDIPKTTETYLHRAGRAGRFGRFGNCVTVYSSETLPEMEQLESQLGIDFAHLLIEISVHEKESFKEDRHNMNTPMVFIITGKVIGMDTSYLNGTFGKEKHLLL